VLLSGTVLMRFFVVPLRVWIVGGCLVSGASLMALGYGAQFAPAWPIGANVFALGLANGVFAVAAIGAMMGIARDGTEAREGARMGVFGAAQAIGFGLGSFGGTVAADIMRSVMTSDAAAYGSVFAAEGLVFLIAAMLALRVTAPDRAAHHNSNLVPGE
jgi:MFS transporter, BCD family, chlorophyll transporter